MKQSSDYWMPGELAKAVAVARKVFGVAEAPVTEEPPRMPEKTLAHYRARKQEVLSKLGEFTCHDLRTVRGSAAAQVCWRMAKQGLLRVVRPGRCGAVPTIYTVSQQGRKAALVA